MLHSSGGVLSSRPRPSLSLVSHDLSPVHGGRIEDVQVREMAILEAQTTEHVYFVAHYGGSVTPSGDVSLNAVLHPSPWDGVRVDPLPAVGEKFQDMDRTNRLAVLDLPVGIHRWWVSSGGERWKGPG